MGMMNVTPEQMNAVATELQGKISEWESAVQKINTLVSEMDVMWDGNANDSFNAKFQEDQTKFTQLQQIMGEYTVAINTAARNYVEAEEQIKCIVTR